MGPRQYMPSACFKLGNQHNHVMTALESICNNAGYATKHKRVLTSAGQHRADLEILNIQVAHQIDLLVDVTLRHDFVGAGHNGLNQGQLRNPDNPDKLLDSAAADKIRHYRASYSRKLACGILASVYDYLGSHPRRVPATALLHLQQTGS